MHEVAHVASRTLVGVVLATTRLAKVVDGTQLAPHGPLGKPPRVELVAHPLGVLLGAEPQICVARQMIVAVFAHNHFLQTAELGGLHVDVLVEERKVLVEISRAHFGSVLVERISLARRRILVQVGTQNRVRVCGLDVFA